MARGHVRKRKMKRPRSDGRRTVWDAWCPAPSGPDGSRRTVVRKGFATERDARAWVGEQLALTRRGIRDEAGSLGDLLEATSSPRRRPSPDELSTLRRRSSRPS